MGRPPLIREDHPGEPVREHLRYGGSSTHRRRSLGLSRPPPRSRPRRSRPTSISTRSTRGSGEVMSTSCDGASWLPDPEPRLMSGDRSLMAIPAAASAPSFGSRSTAGEECSSLFQQGFQPPLCRLCRWTSLGILGQHQRSIDHNSSRPHRVAGVSVRQCRFRIASTLPPPKGSFQRRARKGRIRPSRRRQQTLPAATRRAGRHVLRVPTRLVSRALGRSFDDPAMPKAVPLAVSSTRYLDQHVVGLDVAMHDALGVRHRQALEQIDTNLDRLFGSEAMTAPSLGTD